MNTVSYILFLFLSISFKVIGQDNVKPDLLQQTELEAVKLTLNEPYLADPVSVSAKLVWSDDKSQLAIIVKAKTLDGWHIYAYVPPTQPYIQTKMVFEIPDGLTAISDWEKPSPYPSEANVFVYQGEFVFTRFFKVEKVTNQILKCGLFYQTCDLRQCLPPTTKEFELNIEKP